MKHFWNDRYNREEYIYGLAPNQFFAAQLSQWQPGRLLLPAEGEGRNAIHAAKQGWEVLAIDFSEAGRKKALQLASQEEVDLTYQIDDITRSPYPTQYFDAVALIYAHLPKAQQGPFLQQMDQTLRPGGTLLMEVFHHEQLGNTSGGPKKIDLLYHEDELQALLKGWQIHLLEKASIQLDEGDHHQGPAEVVRVVAQKPGLQEGNT